MKPSTPFADLAALKRSTDLVAVVQTRGVKLTKQGADFVGLCPFHEEDTPSFHVTPSKNLFHCFGCGAAGSVIDFVMKKDGLTKQEAIDWLVKQSGGAVRRAEAVVAAPSLPDGDRAKLLQRVVAFYAKTLMQDRDGFDYLKRRNLADPTALEIFQVGYCNGTLNQALPKSGETIDALKAIGILNQHGRESFLGRVVVPIFDPAGNVCGLYGRKIEDAEPRHLYLKNDPSTPLRAGRRGVWNSTAAKTSQTLFIAEAILDGLALWQAGFKNVIAIYGTEGWTPDHETLIRENGTTEVFLCLDNDEAGRAATERLKHVLSGVEGEKLSALVKAVHVVTWPDQVKDAAEFFLSRSAADFESLVKAACPSLGVSAPLRETESEQIEMTPDGFAAVFASRRYELRAIEKPSAARLKATVKAQNGDASRFHIDTVDFFLSRSRRGFIVEAARLFRETPEVIEKDVNRLTVQLETYVEKRDVEARPPVALVSEDERAAALRLGRSPDLVGEILRDLAKLGLVGERHNGLLGYLAMTSRKMEDPLALLILSGSGAGKSHLQDTVLSLCPEEDLVKVTSLSDQALYYKGEDALKHKVLAIEEEAGALGADYAIRNLISAKKIVREIAIKNPLNGRMETQTSRVNGPAAVLKTTTNPQTNAETRSRFFVTSVDESSGQTRAIVEAQRHRNTLEGLLRRQEAAAILARHHAFQRLLRPVRVVNPFEPLLTYGDDRLLVRRDNPKYLRLILAVAFLHQMQRPVKTHPVIGDYIEVTLEDIATANDLALQVLGQSLDELSAPSRRLLAEIAAYVGARAAALKVPASQVEFSRRELRETLRWSESRLRIHLGELAQMEYLAPTVGKRGLLYCYRLVYDGEAAGGSRFLPGLKTVEQLRQEMKAGGVTSPVKTEVRRSFRQFAGGSPVPTGEVSGGGLQRGNGHGKGPFAGFGGGHVPGKLNGSSTLLGTGKRVAVGV